MPFAVRKPEVAYVSDGSDSVPHSPYKEQSRRFGYPPTKPTLYALTSLEPSPAFRSAISSDRASPVE
jgi:hypothetical protein